MEVIKRDKAEDGVSTPAKIPLDFLIGYIKGVFNRPAMFVEQQKDAPQEYHWPEEDREN